MLSEGIENMFLEEHQFPPPGMSNLTAANNFTQNNLIKTVQNNGVDSFSNELNRLQEQQINIGKKIEKEKKRREEYDLAIDEAKQNLRAIQDKTKNGSIANDMEIKNKKLLFRLEYELQATKTKFSVAKNENATLKKKIDDYRLEKALNIQIAQNLYKEESDLQHSIKQCQKDILLTNEKKSKTKMMITNAKNKMLRDIEDFSREISLAKQSITNTQQTLLSTIRERVQTAYQEDQQFESAQSAFQYNDTDYRNLVASHQQQEILNVLKDTEFKKVEELVLALQSSEEKMFSLYSDTQSKQTEMEKIELEIKHFETEVEKQIVKLQDLEGHNDQVRLELEKNILSLKNQIRKYEQEYQRNIEVLTSISDSMLGVLKTVAIDEVAMDQQLLSTGINDRNIDEFLGLIEQRIDDLIQMSKAAMHQSIRRDDFIKIGSMNRLTHFQTPMLPSLQDGNDDDDDTDEGGGVKFQPINISALKEIMQRKVQKMAVGNHVPTNTHSRGGIRGHLANSHSSSKQGFSRASSNHSLHSQNSASNSYNSNT